MLKFIVLTIGLLVTACATVPMASPEEDARAKNYRVAANESVIYLYRHEQFGSAVKIGIRLDGKSVGETASQTYFMWKVSPGTHRLSCEGETNRDFEFLAPAGQAIYIWQEMKMGVLYARCTLHQVEQAKARQDMSECRLAR